MSDRPRYVIFDTIETRIERMRMNVRDVYRVDRFGNRWPEDFVCCEECGQPDNCGDCNHNPLSASDVLALGGLPVPEGKENA